MIQELRTLASIFTESRHIFYLVNHDLNLRIGKFIQPKTKDYLSRTYECDESHHRIRFIGREKIMLPYSNHGNLRDITKTLMTEEKG